MRKMASKTFLAVMLLIVVFFISGCGSSNGGNVNKVAYEIIDDQGAIRCAKSVYLPLLSGWFPACF